MKQKKRRKKSFRHSLFIISNQLCTGKMRTDLKKNKKNDDEDDDRMCVTE